MALKVSSTSVVNYNLARLAERGLLEREPEVSRGLRLTKQGLEFLGVHKTRKASDAIKRMVQIPIVGRIAASKPINLPNTEYTLFDEGEFVDISIDMLPSKVDGLFALTVRGEAMIDAMVNDGDIVVMKEQRFASDGDMVAVWLKEHNLTALKHYYHKDSQICLQPINPAMPPIYVAATDVEVQGKIVSDIENVLSEWGDAPTRL